MYDFIKRLRDILVSIGVLVLFAPIFLIISLIIKIESRGPILFSQMRVGKNGKLFVNYKLRTMHDADDDRHENS
jgi:lipopolysaccharide/colanic/teichoic acid biosynthesis glycosyltransferase